MYKITATVYTDSTVIKKEGTTEFIGCEERVDDLGEIQEIIMYHWELDADEYELTLTVEERCEGHTGCKCSGCQELLKRMN